MTKKVFSVFKPILLLPCLVAVFGCNSKKDKISSDPKTINVRLYKAGYGEEFIYEIQEHFEEVFAEEGYKVNVLTPSYDTAGDVVLTELAQGYNKTGVDLYITGAVTPNMVSASGQYGEVVENIEESVFNQPCINYDGTEGSKVSELINPDNIDFLRADDGNMFGFAWAEATAGLVVNSKKLAAYGIETLPRTTNEFLAACEKIYYGAPEKNIKCSAESKTYPITYTIGKTGYADCAFQSWQAQLGIEKFKEFTRMQTFDGTKWNDMTNGYNVYNDADLEEVMYQAFRFMDINFAASGSTTQNLDQAQAEVMKDLGQNNTAVFMFNGDWFLNEIRLNYRTKLDDIEFINVPVISKVGINVFSKYGKNDAECDQLLSYACSLVDQNLTKEEIKEKMLSEKGLTLSDEDVTTLCDARGVCLSRGTEHLAYITKGSTKKDICALFLRMMASQDFAKTFLSNSNCSTPYSSNVEIPENTKAFVKEAKSIVENRHYRAVRPLVRGLRRDVGINTYFPKIQYASQNIANQNISMYNGNGGIATGKDESVYRTAAHTFCATALNDAKSMWELYFSTK